MPRDDLAWAAGLFEGEGCFSTVGKVGIHGRQSARACLGMVDTETVRRFHRVMGVGRLHINRRKNGNDLTIWAVSNAAEFRFVVKTLWPWLSERRRNRATELLARMELPKADPWEKRRMADTAKNKKLTTEQVLAIRAATGTYDEIAAQFGTARSNVGHIRTRKTWKYL